MCFACQITKARTQVYQIYRVIKKPLCTWWLQHNRQVHGDFLIFLYISAHRSLLFYWLCIFSHFRHTNVTTR